MLFVDGTGWDDMYVWNVTSEKMYAFLGPDNFNNPIMLWIFQTICKFPDITSQTIAYRLGAFFGNFIQVISIWLILRKITNDINFTTLVSLLVAACAVNKCMILICCYHYTFSNALFLLGLLAFIYDFYKHSFAKLLLCAALWFASFSLWKSAALLMPFVIIVASVLKSGFNLNTPSSYMTCIVFMLKKYWVIIISLLFAAILYITKLSPHGIYDSYYEVGISNIILSPLTTLVSCISLFIGYCGNVISSFANRKTELFLLSLLISIFVYVVALRKDKSKLKISINKKFIVLVALFLYFSVYPQMLKGRIAFVCDIDTYNSKTASLAALSICVFIIYILSKFPYKLRLLSFSIILSGSIIYSMSVYMDYNRFWAKKICVIDYLKSNKGLQDKKILIIDTVDEYDAFPRGTSTYYDYDGCARFAYGKNTKTSFYTYFPKQERDNSQEYDYTIYLTKDADISSFELMKLRILNKDEYISRAHEMMSINTVN
jgi:hypothetical protein